MGLLETTAEIFVVPIHGLVAFVREIKAKGQERPEIEIEHVLYTTENLADEKLLFVWTVFFKFVEAVGWVVNQNPTVVTVDDNFCAVGFAWLLLEEDFSNYSQRTLNLKSSPVVVTIDLRVP